MYIYTGYQDLFIYPGCTLQWNLQLAPCVPATDATLTIDGIGSFAVTVTSGYIGTTPYAQFGLEVAADTTAAWVPNPYSFRVSVDFSDGSTQDIVEGVLLVKETLVIS
jgi:hypothetical protein